MIMHIFYHPNFKDHVSRWQEKFDLSSSVEPPVDQVGYYLYYDGRRLKLHYRSDSKGICLRDSMVRKRSNTESRLAKACGITRNTHPQIIDGTGGLGIDAMTLVSLGCDVHVFERNPSLWALIDDYIRVSGTGLLNLYNQDSLDWLLKKREPCCDVLYLDPIFPGRSKKALPGKEMQYVRDLCSEDRLGTSWSGFISSGGMNQLASLVRQRIVLKRRRKDPILDRPSWQIKGKMVRYDVYRSKSAL